MENSIRSPSRFSEKAVLILTGKSEVQVSVEEIGPPLLSERVRRELGIGKIIEEHVERAIFLTVLHQLPISGADCSCDTQSQDYEIDGAEELSLLHLYPVIAFGEEGISQQRDRSPFAPGYRKDVLELVG
jgi:hypothetical protein